MNAGPGSFFEVRKLLPILVEPSLGNPSFHVVAVSLPGYGFSEAPKKKGFEATQMAEVAHKVMLSVGYTQYGMHVFPEPSVADHSTLNSGARWRLGVYDL
jgi:pimeloyl-ACP methyl ester carboxylesterase